MKKNKKHKSPDYKRLPADQLERNAQTEMQHLNYRKAKDFLKELHRRNPEKYLHSLVSCYEALAKQMIQRGQTADAKVVLEHIRSLTGKDVPPETLALFSAGSGDYTASARTFLKILTSAPESLSSDMRRKAADTLVLSFTDFSGDTSVDQTLVAELATVHTALQNVSEKKYDEAAQCISALGWKSIFSSWKLFIKGLCCYYTCRDDRALDCFKRLEQEPLLSRASRPFIYLLDENARSLSKHTEKESFFRCVCRVLNRPDMEGIIPRAEYLWTTKRHKDSYAYILPYLRQNLSALSGLPFSLVQFYINIIFTMEEDVSMRYTEQMIKLTSTPSEKTIDKLILNKMICLDIIDTAPFDNHIVEGWESFLKMYADMFGQNARVSSVVYCHIAEIFSDTFYPDLFFSRRQAPQMRNPELAEKILLKSLQYNPENKKAHLLLLKVYEETRNKSKANKKLDELSKLYPDDKTVVMKNAESCFSRKAYQKGLGNFRKAIELDPLDFSAKESFCVCLIRASLDMALKGKQKKYREMMQAAIDLNASRADNLTTSETYLKIRLGIFELMNGFENRGMEILENEFSRNTSVNRFYFAYLMSDAYHAPDRVLRMLEKRYEQELPEPLPAVAVSLIRVFLYAAQVRANIEGDISLSAEHRKLAKYVNKTLTQPCSEDEAVEIIRWELFSGNNKTALKKFINRLLKKHPDSPKILFMKYQAEMKGVEGISFNRKSTLLKKIIKLASERGEHEFAKKVSKELKDIEMALDMFGWGDDDFLDDDVNDGEESWHDPWREPRHDEGDDFFEMPRKQKGRRRRTSSKRKPKQKSLFDLF